MMLGLLLWAGVLLKTLAFYWEKELMLLLARQKIKYLILFPADLLLVVWIIRLKFGSSYKKDKSINKLVSYLEIKEGLMMIGYAM